MRFGTTHGRQDHTYKPDRRYERCHTQRHVHKKDTLPNDNTVREQQPTRNATSHIIIESPHRSIHSYVHEIQKYRSNNLSFQGYRPTCPHTDTEGHINKKRYRINDTVSVHSSQHAVRSPHDSATEERHHTHTLPKRPRKTVAREADPQHLSLSQQTSIFVALEHSSL